MGLSKIAKTYGLELESPAIQRAVQKASREWVRLRGSEDEASSEDAAQWLDSDANFYGLFVRCVLEDRTLPPQTRLLAARSLMEVTLRDTMLVHHCLLAMAYVTLRSGLTRTHGQWLVTALATSTSEQQFRTSAEAVAFIRIVLRSGEIATRDRALLAGLLLSDTTLAPPWGNVLLAALMEAHSIERKVLRGLCRRIVEGGDPLAGLRPSLTLAPLKALAAELGDDMEPEVLLAVSLMRQSKQDRLLLYGARSFPEGLAREAVVAMGTLGEDSQTLIRWALTRSGNATRSHAAALGAMDVLEKEARKLPDLVLKGVLHLASNHAALDIRNHAVRLATQLGVRITMRTEPGTLRRGMAAAQ